MIETPYPNKKSTIFFVIIQFFVLIPLHAAGFQWDQTSPSLQGSALAGIAASNNDVTTLANNPATLSTLTQNQAYIGSSEFLPRLNTSKGKATHSFNLTGDPFGEMNNPVEGLSSEKGVSQSVFLPNAYLGERINDQFTFGLAINEPYYWSVNYSPNSVLRFSSIKTKLKSLDAHPALAYKINESWSVGAGVIAQYLKVTFINFNGFYSGFSLIDELLAASNPSYSKGNGWGYGYTLGTLFKPGQYTRLGLGYRSLIVTHLNGRGEQYTTKGGLIGTPSHSFLYNGLTEMSINIKTPATLIFSLAQDLNRWTLKATAQLSFWDSFKTLTLVTPEAYIAKNRITMNWRKAWFSSLGADYRVSHHWILRGGLAFVQSPMTKTYRNTLFPDSNQLSTHVGLTYALNDYLSIDGAYSHRFQNNFSVNFTQAAKTGINSLKPIEMNQIKARYQDSVNVVALGLRYSC